MEKMARPREGGENAAVSSETSGSRLDDELRLDLPVREERSRASPLGWF
jgi:hypothetical protein